MSSEAQSGHNILEGACHGACSVSILLARIPMLGRMRDVALCHVRVDTTLQSRRKCEAASVAAAVHTGARLQCAPVGVLDAAL